MSWTPEEVRKFQKKENDKGSPVVGVLVWLFIAWAIFEYFFA